MLKSTSVPVQITTFINPHLFWFFEKKEEENRVAFEKCMIRSVKTCLMCGFKHGHLIQNPQIGQTVLIDDKSIWKRAIVKSIENNSYTTWLIDYGIIYKSRQLYLLPKEFRHQEPFVKQAALIDVVNVKHVLDIYEFKLISTEKFCVGTAWRAEVKIEDAHSIFFDCLNEKNNIHLGEVNIIDSDNCVYDLAKVLIQDRNLTYDKELFEKALEVNTKIDDWDILSSVKCSIPCTSMIRRKHEDFLKEIEDILEAKPCGRGMLRNSCLRKKGKINNKKRLENWSEESKEAKQSEELFCDADDESRISETSRETK